VKRIDVTAIQECGVHSLEVVKLKSVSLRAKQARGDLEVNSCMSVEAFCMLLICTNLLQPTST